jgi:hypothetical protein
MRQSNRSSDSAIDRATVGWFVRGVMVAVLIGLLGLVLLYM